MEALLIKTQTRQLRLVVVQLTRTKLGLVIREAFDMLPLWAATKDDARIKFDMPIIVPTKGFSARSSYGFVSVKTHEVDLPYVVGYMRLGKSLRPVNPFQVYIANEGFILKKETHQNLNYQTAAVCMSGVDLFFKKFMPIENALIIEGQSNETDVYEVIHKTKDGESLSIPYEHQQDKFTWESIAQAYLKAKASDSHPMWTLYQAFKEIEDESAVSPNVFWDSQYDWQELCNKVALNLIEELEFSLNCSYFVDCEDKVFVGEKPWLKLWDIPEKFRSRILERCSLSSIAEEFINKKYSWDWESIDQPLLAGDALWYVEHLKSPQSNNYNRISRILMGDMFSPMDKVKSILQGMECDEYLTSPPEFIERMVKDLTEEESDEMKEGVLRAVLPQEVNDWIADNYPNYKLDWRGFIRVAPKETHRDHLDERGVTWHIWVFSSTINIWCVPTA